MTNENNTKTLTEKLKQPMTWYDSWIAKKAEKMPEQVIVALGDTIYGRKRAEEYKQAQLRPGFELMQIDALKISYTLEQRKQEARDKIKQDTKILAGAFTVWSCILGLAAYQGIKNRDEILKNNDERMRSGSIEAKCAEKDYKGNCNAISYNGQTYRLQTR